MNSGTKEAESDEEVASNDDSRNKRHKRGAALAEHESCLVGNRV